MSYPQPENRPSQNGGPVMRLALERGHVCLADDQPDADVPGADVPTSPMVEAPTTQAPPVPDADEPQGPTCDLREILEAHRQRSAARGTSTAGAVNALFDRLTAFCPEQQP